MAGRRRLTGTVIMRIDGELCAVTLAHRDSDCQSPYSGVISIFTDKLKSNEVPTIFGDGEQTRDFVYVSDVVEANMRAVTENDAAGQVCNIATGHKITLNELLNTLYEIKGQEFAANYDEPRQGDIKESYAKVDKAAEVLNWKSTVELKQGLQILLGEQNKELNKNTA